MYQKWRGKYVYNLSVELAKKQTLFHDSAHFCWIFLTSIILASHFGALRGLLGALGAMALLWGPLRAPMNSLPSLAILTPSLVQPPAQSVKFVDFWSLPKQ